AQRIVSLRHPGLVCLRWTLRLDGAAGPIDISSGIHAGGRAAAQGDDPRVGAGAGLLMHVSDAAADADGAWLAQHTRNSGIAAVCAQRHRVTGAAFAGAAFDNVSARQLFVAELASGASLTIEKYITYAWTSPQGVETDAELCAQARATLHTAMAAGADSLF